ncbi:hypothetical protein ACFQAS_01615 [Halopenitus salinus]|uniref:Pentapeptide repeat-containing protein n=1 Tax=Halopenitus salinus TaxID=1198295 RepID=A0ABD5UYG2_9EURY
MASCTYSFDSQDWQKERGVDIIDHWTWDCPHEQYGENTERCIFHMSSHARDAAGIGEGEFRERFIEDILRGEENELHGATLDDLPLDFLSLRNTADRPINLRANTFQQLSFTNAQVRSAILLDYSTFTDFDVSHAVFDHALGLQRVVIDGTFSAVMADLDRIYGEGLTAAEIDLAEAEIDRAGFHEAHIDVFRCPNANLSVILTEATFYEEFTVDNAMFETVVDGQETTFECSCTISEAEFTDKLRLEESTFDDGLEIEGSTLQGVGLAYADVAGDLRISDCTIDTLVLDAATIDEELWVQAMFGETLRASKITCEKAWFSDVTTDKVDIFDIDVDQLVISADHVDELHIKSSDLPSLHISDGEYDSIGVTDSVIRDFAIIGCEIHSLNLVEVTINGDHQQNEIGDARFRNTDVHDISWRGCPVDRNAEIRFIGGSLEEGDLHQPDSGCFRFAFYQTTVGNIQFHNINGDDLQQAHFVAPDFDNFPFDDYTAELAPTWRLNVTPEFEDADFDPGQLEAYQTYQSARASAGASNQEDARAGFYKREMQYRGDILRDRWSEDRHWDSLFKWLELRLLDWICGYGEDPGRPVLIAIGTISIFAVIYTWMLCGTGTTADNFLTGITLSFQAFATLVFGPSETFYGLPGRFLTSLEGVIATLLIPFLVFSLTKSID